MKVLGIDTSNSVMSLAVMEQDKLIGEYTTNLNKDHSSRLMPAISLLLDACNISPMDLTGISVASGPGSYTGLRIGVTTAKSLAWALDIPLVGVSSLESLASNGSFVKEYVCPLFDARRQQVYTSLFQHGQRVEADQIILAARWLEHLEQLAIPILFLGDHVSLHEEMIIESLGERAHFAPPEWNVPRASYVARKGIQAIKQGDVADVHALAPEYVQMAEAEVNWLAAQRNLER